MTTSEDVGRRIRDAREAKGLTQAQLGQLLERPRTHAAISDIERGRTKLNLDEIAEFARLLDRPEDYFTGQRPRSIGYRRSNSGATPEERREQDAAAEDFKALVRKRFGLKG